MEIYNKLRHFELVDQIIPCLEHCGQKIMEIYEDFNIDIQIKEDNSPLTKADIASHQIICECLNLQGTQLYLRSQMIFIQKHPNIG